jgi:superfamily I DNA/RNA helicase
VAIASLTNTAAAEIRARTKLTDRSMVEVGTLHKLCMNAIGIGQEQLVVNYLDEWAEEAKRLRHPEWRLTEEAKPDTRGDRFLQAANLARDQRLPRAKWVPLVGLREFFDAYTAWKRAHEILDFHDCIEQTVETGALPLVGGHKPDTVCIDEVQDSSPLELYLVREVWAPKIERVILAGDPDQCIFSGIRAIDPRMFMDYPAAGSHLLEQSYRIPRSVHRWAQRTIRQIRERVDVNYHPRDAEGEVRRASEITSRYPDPILRHLDTWLGEGTVMVLAATEFPLFPLLKLLRQRGIPFANPWAPKRGDWNPLVLKRKDAVTTVSQLLAFLDGWESWTPDAIRLWLGLLQSTGLLVRGAKSDPKVSSPWTFAELRALFLQESDFDRALDRDVAWLLEHSTKARRKTLEFALRVYEKRGREALETPPQLFVGTAHSLKGSEADTVVVFPDLTPAMWEASMKQKARDTQTRTFYVSMTRAKHRLVLAGPSSRRQFEFRAPA